MNFKYLLTCVFSLLIFHSFSQFDRRQEQRIKIADDTARKHNELFIMHARIHYGLVAGIHQCKQTNIELGIHRTKRMVNGIYAGSVSYEYNVQNKRQGLSGGAWLGAVLGAGIFASVNTIDFKKYALTLRPMVGFEYYYAGLYYAYNINFWQPKTPGINTHTVTLRIHLAFITRKGIGISKW